MACSTSVSQRSKASAEQVQKGVEVVGGPVTGVNYEERLSSYETSRCNLERELMSSRRNNPSYEALLMMKILSQEVDFHNMLRHAIS